MAATYGYVSERRYVDRTMRDISFIILSESEVSAKLAIGGRTELSVKMANTE